MYYVYILGLTVFSDRSTSFIHDYTHSYVVQVIFLALHTYPHAKLQFSNVKRSSCFRCSVQFSCRLAWDVCLLAAASSCFAFLFYPYKRQYSTINLHNTGKSCFACITLYHIYPSSKSVALKEISYN